jgi:predicted nucleic acid-binding protein
MKVLCDTGPLVSATDPRDPAHRLAADLITAVGKDLLVPIGVAVETDHFLRKRAGATVARTFLQALKSGAHGVAYMTPGLLRRAVEIDAQYADLNLGLTNACLMSFAERHDLAVLTFDFRAFRATRPQRGHWKLVVDEARYASATGA